jgi:prepilin-type N-terminal cleavage/methylation domain-containing protein
MNVVRQQPVVTPLARPTGAFTLVELLVAIAIGLIILGLAVPTLRKAIRPPLAQATRDFLDACIQARSRAIMESRAMQIVIRDGGGEITVEPAPEGVTGATNGVSAVSYLRRMEGDGPEPYFARRFADGVAFEAISVNQRNFMDAPAAAVRFFPNGTADQFDGVMSWHRGEARRLTVEVMTGIADVENVR